MGSDENKPGPISWLICAAAALATLVISLTFLPAAELLPAQVNPEVRSSGESCVRLPEVMNQYGGLGLQMLQIVPPPKAESETAVSGVVADWKKQLIEANGEKYGNELATNIQNAMGGEQNLKMVLEMLHVDKNFVYNAYALFLGLALFAGAVAIQAMGRWGAEEKTILPVKK